MEGGGVETVYLTGKNAGSNRVKDCMLSYPEVDIEYSSELKGVDELKILFIYIEPYRT